MRSVVDERISLKAVARGKPTVASGRKAAVLSSLILLLLTLGWGDRSGGEQVSVPRGELRIVDKRPTNRFSIQNHTIEGLVGIDYQERMLVPRLASGWRKARLPRSSRSAVR